MFTKQSSFHGAQKGDFLNFELGHFDLPNQLCDCIPGVGTYERRGQVNLVNTELSLHVPYSITFWFIILGEVTKFILDTDPRFWAPC